MPCDFINHHPAWKRQAADLWVVSKEDFSWVCVDDSGVIFGIPWGIAVNKMGELPPIGEWISKKGDKCYVYEMSYL